MPILMDRSMKDFSEQYDKDMMELDEWERNRVVRRCKSCGQAYSFEKGEDDPKKCMRCRGAEGDLVY